jgi:outer membrane protein assembly factor BamB
MAAVDAESGDSRWTTDTGHRVYYGVVTTGGTVYVTGLRTVTALASADGRTRWSLDVDPLIGTVPAVSGGCLYVGTGGSVAAFCAPPTSDAG